MRGCDVYVAGNFFSFSLFVSMSKKKGTLSSAKKKKDTGLWTPLLLISGLWTPPHVADFCHVDPLVCARTLQVFDPKQLPLRDTTWEKNKEIFGFSDTMWAHWELYVNVDSQKAKQVEDPMQLWSALSGPLSELVVALLGMPVTSADVEGSVSFGLLDDPNRGNARPDLRRCAVALFVNSDVEGRF